MRPQPPEYVGFLCMLAFVGLVIFYTIKAIKQGHQINLHNFDLVNIGVVEDSPPTVCVIQQENAKLDFETQQLYLDCIEALHALGMKKSEAKRKTKFIFNTFNPPPKTIQEFLTLALS